MGERSYLGLRGTPLNVAIGIIAGLDFLLFGYDQGVLGNLFSLSTWLKHFPQTDTSTYHNSLVQGITTASYNLGCFLGALMCIFVANPLGRRRVIFLGSSIMIIGATLQATAFEISHLIVGRIITGIGNGFNTSTVPTWQSECSKAHRRGQLVMIEGSLITLGIMISYWLDFGLSFADRTEKNIPQGSVHSEAAWRFPIAFQIFFAGIILFFVMLLPESPRWLIFKGREDEATEVLSAILDLPPEDGYVKQEFTAIKDTVLLTKDITFRDLFTMDENRHFHRVCLAYVNQMFQQISGINLITYYIPYILETNMKTKGVIARLIAALNGTEYFLASLVPIFIIEKIGRRPLMLFGAAGMSLSMVALAISDSFAEGDKYKNTPAQKHGSVAATVFFFVFNTFFAIGWLGMTWLYPAEIVPLRIRAPANAVSTSANWIFNFLVVMISPPCQYHIRYKTYVIFAVINFVIFPATYFFFPETAYRSLEEMDTIFNKTKSIFTLVSVASNEPRRYGKNGELLIAYEETEEHKRRASYAGGGEKAIKTDRDVANPEHGAEGAKGTHIERRHESESSE